MPVVNGIGTSDHTPLKEQGLESILSLHLRIAKGIIARPYANPLYHWYDINAGCGTNPDCPGSPVVFLDTADRLGVRYCATFIEENECNVARLAACIGARPGVVIRCGDNRTILPEECRQLNGRAYRYGMIYHDPNGDPSWDLLADVSRMPAPSKIDILIQVSATTVKRVRGRFKDRDGLLDQLATIEKRYWLVRDISCSGPWQWTFLLGTNWAEFPEYSKAGFYRTDSTEGADILHLCATTIAERERECQLAMFDPTTPMPSI